MRILGESSEHISYNLKHFHCNFHENSWKILEEFYKIYGKLISRKIRNGVDVCEVIFEKFKENFRKILILKESWCNFKEVLKHF